MGSYLTGLITNLMLASNVGMVVSLHAAHYLAIQDGVAGKFSSNGALQSTQNCIFTL